MCIASSSFKDHSFHLVTSTGVEAEGISHHSVLSSSRNALWGHGPAASPHESWEGSGCLLAPLARVTGPEPCLHLTPGLKSHSDQSWGCVPPPPRASWTDLRVHRMKNMALRTWRNSFLLVLSRSSCTCAHLHCSNKDVPTHPETVTFGEEKKKKSTVEAEDRKGQMVCFPSSDLSNAASEAQSRNPIQSHSS